MDCYCPKYIKMGSDFGSRLWWEAEGILRNIVGKPK